MLSLLAAFGMFFYISRQVPWLSFLPQGARLPGLFLSFVIGFAYLCHLLFKVPHTSFRDQMTRAVWLFLPSGLLFALGYAFSGKFPTDLKVFMGVYFFFAGYLFIRSLLEAKKGDTQYVTDEKFPLKAFFLGLVFLGIFLFFGLKNIGQFAAVDEAFWLYGRIQRYYSNFLDGEWHKTAVSDKPGITVSMLAGPGLLWDNHPRDMEDYTGQGHSDGGRSIIDFYKTFRIPFYLGATVLLALIIYFLFELFNSRQALIISALLTTSPILIGVPKIINPDGLLWLFTTLAILAYLLYRKKPFRRYLILSGVFFGFALLTKYVANILIIFLFAYFALEYVFYRTPPAEIPQFLKRRLTDFFVFFYFGILIYYLFLPAAWIEPRMVIDATLTSQAFQSFALLFILIVLVLAIEIYLNGARILSWLSPWFQKLRLPLALFILLAFYGSAIYVFAETWTGMHQYNFLDLLSSPKNIGYATGFLGIFFSNFYIQLFSQTTPIIFGLLFLAIGLARHVFKNARIQLESQSAYWFLFTLPLLYYLGSALTGVGSIIRYQIIVYPIVIILAGIGFAWLADYAKKRLSLPDYFASTFIIVSLLAYGLWVLMDTPFPASYSSRLLPKQDIIDVKDMGAGSYEMAALLNALPHASELTIWTDKGGVCTFFVGRCLSSTGKVALSNPLIDYVVVSSGRASRVMGMAGSKTEKHPEYIPLYSYYERTDPNLAFYVNGRETQYVKAFAYHSILRDEYEQKMKDTRDAEDRAFIDSFEKSMQQQSSENDPLAGSE